jgi:hypothetical protein
MFAYGKLRKFQPQLRWLVFDPIRALAADFWALLLKRNKNTQLL